MFFWIISQLILAKAVENRISGVTLEASGGINLNNILGYIKTGVDRISIETNKKYLFSRFFSEDS